MEGEEKIFSENLAVLAKRWPSLAQMVLAQDIGSLAVDLRKGIESTITINGIQLSSRHDRIGEARLQAESLQGSCPFVYLYGPGLGELPRAFLKRSDVQKLEVRILNEKIFALVMHLVDQTDWLGSPRVSLAMAGDDRNIFLPFFASPPELTLASDTNAKIRDRLVCQMTAPFMNKDFLPNDLNLLARVESNRTLLASDGDVSEFFNSRPGDEAWVIATGPSLERHFEQICASRNQGSAPFLIAVDSALVPLHKHGIRPDIVVSIDKLMNAHILPPDISDGLPLVYFPLLEPALLEAWKGPRYAAYSTNPLYSKLKRDVPKGELFVGGSVLHAAVDLAVKMGVRRLVLFGADFSYVEGKFHADWDPGEIAPDMEPLEWVLNGHGKRVGTQTNLRNYLCALEDYVALHPDVIFLNTCRDGAWIAGTDYHPELVA
ncbi:motility associated factor glycosyltransferase family protein [Azonexus hydrophilus]|jgi:hypothetical protein|uniref:6-hydroxymethylpterin diphosphokinase MptE-like protein n=1 Tax=Azonexus hydrophilus TaxID=418702 RepID=A0ABZ2XG67_9RHOO|nr:motility associated factor glycosyltransferase family protein [Dechloromonas sp.]